MKDHFDHEAFKERQRLNNALGGATSAALEAKGRARIFGDDQEKAYDAAMQQGMGRAGYLPETTNNLTGKPAESGDAALFTRTTWKPYR
jgi:hypothetical protein